MQYSWKAHTMPVHQETLEEKLPLVRDPLSEVETWQRTYCLVVV